MPAEREDCYGTCPGGNDCCLYEDVDHEFCICTDPECTCHKQERYMPVKKADPMKSIQTLSIKTYAYSQLVDRQFEMTVDKLKSIKPKDKSVKTFRLDQVEMASDDDGPVVFFVDGEPVTFINDMNQLLDP